jgi:hypothetical protein
LACKLPGVWVAPFLELEEAADEEAAAAEADEAAERDDAMARDDVTESATVVSGWCSPVGE